jgi:plastocyanin
MYNSVVSRCRSPTPTEVAVKKSLAVFLAALMVVSLLVLATVALAATKRVGVRQPNRWSTSSVTINRGDAVRWSWRGGPPHNVVGRGFKSRTAARLTYTRTFRRSGSYRISCSVHARTMRMTVRVR